MVVLGDNLLQNALAPAVSAYLDQGEGARILLKEVPDPQRFGVAEVEGGRVTKIIEKPKDPRSNLAVTGIYMYDAQVFDMIGRLKPSERGELEITDVNNMYLERGQLEYDMVDGWWSDAGTFESLYKAAALVRDGGANHAGERAS